MSNHALETGSGRAIGFLFEDRDQSLLARAGQSIASAWAGYRNWAEARRATRHLAGLDERMLRDIGVSRSEINRMVFGPRIVGTTSHEGR